MMSPEQVFSEPRGEISKSGEGVRSGLDSFERLETILLRNETRDYRGAQPGLGFN